MPHPENAYAFNEHSLSCCDTQCEGARLAGLLDVARAWRLHESKPLLDRLKRASDFDDLRRSKSFRDKIVILLDSAVNRPPLFNRAPEELLWGNNVARGITVASGTGGFALSWPCTCPLWNDDLVEGVGARSGSNVPCRHVASAEHLRGHWMRASKAARARLGRPRSVQRVDDAQNPSAGEVPQVHFRDGSALNIDGAWKHGRRDLNQEERGWLARIGWVVPPPVEVR